MKTLINQYFHYFATEEFTSAKRLNFDIAIEKGISCTTRMIRGMQCAWIQGKKMLTKSSKIVQYQFNMKPAFFLIEKINAFKNQLCTSQGRLRGVRGRPGDLVGALITPKFNLSISL